MARVLVVQKAIYARPRPCPMEFLYLKMMGGPDSLVAIELVGRPISIRCSSKQRVGRGWEESGEASNRQIPNEVAGVLSAG